MQIYDLFKIHTDNSVELLISTRNLVRVPTLTERSLSRLKNAGGSSPSSCTLPIRNSKSLDVDPTGDLAFIVYIPASSFRTLSNTNCIVFPHVLCCVRESADEVVVVDDGICVPSLDLLTITFTKIKMF